MNIHYRALGAMEYSEWSKGTGERKFSVLWLVDV